MRNILIILAFSMAALCVVADNGNKEQYHIKGVLVDGTEIDGYNETALQNFMRPWVTEVCLSDSVGKGKNCYNSDELKVVWFTQLGADSIPMVYHAVKAQKRLPHLLNKNPKPYKKPVFLRLIYDGENVKGYIRPWLNQTLGNTMNVYNQTYMFYYLTKDSDIAVAYWDGTNDVTPSMRKVMKFFLREFPALVEMIDKGELTPEMFRSNPAIVLPLIDKTYDSKQK